MYNAKQMVLFVCPPWCRAVLLPSSLLVKWCPLGARCNLEKKHHFTQSGVI